MTDSPVFLNGRLVARAAARIAVDDAGFLLGDGVFETLLARGTEPLFLVEHLVRLGRGLETVQIRPQWSLEEIGSQVQALLNEVSRDEAAAFVQRRVRITVTRGQDAETTTLITAARYQPPPAESYDHGVEVCISPERRAPHPLHAIKSTSRAASDWMRREARERNAFECVQFNRDGFLAEGAYTNVFVVDPAGALCTPAVVEGCLPGVTRAMVLQLAAGESLAVREGGIDRAALAAAAEVFLTGSLVGIVPVRALDGSPVGGGRPGPVTRALAAAYKVLVPERRVLWK